MLPEEVFNTSGKEEGALNKKYAGSGEIGSNPES
jgi:hypothetical protein